MDDYIPQKYLDAIEGFSVEDFDGMEDLTVTATRLRTHSQKMTVAARQMAEKKTVGHLS